MTLHDQSGKPVVLEDKLGSGGEADIYAVNRNAKSVAKIYNAPLGEKAGKLSAMISRPPANPTQRKGHVSICWPQTLLYDQANVPVGFLMPRMDRKTHRELLKLYNPGDRQAEAPDFTWAYLLRAAENVATVVESIHAFGYVVGDMNESNFFVSDHALVTLIDCDSMQVPHAGGNFRCPVGKPEYVAPELQGVSFASVDRNIPHDNFALAVLIFMLLMEGVHPYAGVWTGPGDPPLIEERIWQGECPYAGSPNVEPMPAAVPFEVLPPTLRALFVRAFGTGHKQPTYRPGAHEWREALSVVGQSLKRCTVNPKHEYSNHLARCHWCERTLMLGGVDPFPSFSQTRQKPLDARPFATPGRMNRFSSGSGDPLTFGPFVLQFLRIPLVGRSAREGADTALGIAVQLYVWSVVRFFLAGACLLGAFQKFSILAGLAGFGLSARALVTFIDVFRTISWLSKIVVFSFAYSIGLVLIDGFTTRGMTQTAGIWIFATGATFAIERIRVARRRGVYP